MGKKGATIFLLMQVFFVIFGFALFFGLKAFKESRSVPHSNGAVLEAARQLAENSAQKEQKKDISCNFLHWIGEQAHGAEMQERLKETGRPYRILPPGSMATMDYSPNRINVHTDENGTITAVRCG